MMDSQDTRRIQHRKSTFSTSRSFACVMHRENLFFRGKGVRLVRCRICVRYDGSFVGIRKELRGGK